MKTRVNIKGFLRKYVGVMDFELFLRLQDLEGRQTTAELPSEVVEGCDRKLMGKQLFEESLSRCTRLNNMGREFEKAGNIEGAIKVYEENIQGDDVYPATWSFERLMVLYRRLGEYRKELEVIDRAEKVLCPRYHDLFPKYERRRNTVQRKLERQGVPDKTGDAPRTGGAE